MIDRSVVVKIEECLLLQNRAADGPAEIVEVKNRNLVRRAEIVRRSIQRIVLEKLIRGAMKLVRTALRDLVVDDVAHAILRRECCGAYLYLRSGLEDRDVGVLAHRQRRRGAILQHIRERQI